MITASSIYAANSIRNTARRGAVGFGAPAAKPQAALFDQFIPQSQDFPPECLLLQALQSLQNQSPFLFSANSEGFFLESDRPQVERVRRAFGLTDSDNVRVFVIPRSNRGGRGLSTGSFIYRPTTSRQTERISRSIRRVSREIREIEYGTANRVPNRAEKTAEIEEARELHLLRVKLTEYQQQLRREQQRLANGPRRGWIVVEREE